jgi:signal transduction histidine kinase
MQHCPRARASPIPILQTVQEREGYISKDSIYAISDCLGLPESKIFGVALVEVADTGIAMSRGEMEGLFQDFYRVNNPQTAAVPGKGTTFSVSLPAGS